MALEISYFADNLNDENPVAGAPVSSETRSLTASAQSSGATPSAARYVSMVATEAARFEYGASPTVTATSHYIALNERLWIQAVSGNLVSARTA